MAEQDQSPLDAAWVLIEQMRRMRAQGVTPESQANSLLQARELAKVLRMALLVVGDVLEAQEQVMAELHDTVGQLTDALKAKVGEHLNGDRHLGLARLKVDAEEIERSDVEAMLEIIDESLPRPAVNLPVKADAEVAPYSRVVGAVVPDEVYTGKVSIDEDGREWHERHDGVWQSAIPGFAGPVGTFMPAEALNEITGVHWQGSTRDYEANRDAVNRELSREIINAFGSGRANPPEGDAQTSDGIAETPSEGREGIAQTPEGGAEGIAET